MAMSIVPPVWRSVWIRPDIWLRFASGARLRASTPVGDWSQEGTDGDIAIAASGDELLGFRAFHVKDRARRKGGLQCLLDAGSQETNAAP